MQPFYRNINSSRIIFTKYREFCSSFNRIHEGGWCKVDEINSSNLETIVSGDKTVYNLPEILRSIEQAVREEKSPENISYDQLKILCDQESKSQRHKYLHFLFKKEILKKADSEKKEKKRIKTESRPPKPPDENPGIIYGLGKNAILINVRHSAWNQFYRCRQANSVLFGQKIVIDLDYDQHMIEKERKECAAQLNVIYSYNRKDIDPFDLYFCNANPNAYCVRYFTKNKPKFSDTLITLTEKNYLDIFPKEKLVYLSPHAKETLGEYDSSAIYIIGGFVDTVKKKPISLNKAEAEGIKSYSLPLDDYITWKAGSKSLTINQAFQIMLTLKNTRNWVKALDCVPSRKIVSLKSPSNTQNSATAPADEKQCNINFN